MKEEIARSLPNRFELLLSAIIVLIYRYTRGDSVSVYLKKDSDAQIEISVLDNPNAAVLWRRLEEALERHQAIGESFASIGQFTFSIRIREAAVIVMPISSDDSDEQGIRVSFSPNQDTVGSFPEDRMAGHFKRILQGMIARPDSSVLELDIGSEEERQVMAGCHGAAVGYIEEAVPVLFERQAERTPDAVAIRFKDRVITYRDLNEEANKLAGYLRKRGVRREDFVGVCLDRCPEAISAIMAIMKAGAAYVPVDPSHPESHLRALARDSQVSIIVTRSEFTSKLPTDGVSPICLDLESESIAEENAANVPSELTPDSAAYVMYTSGSTGRPKGVVGVHRSITNGLNALPFQTDARERCCLSSPLSLGISLSRVFLPLLSGISIVMIPDGLEQNFDEFTRICEREEVTNIILVPSALRHILSLGDRVSERMRHIRTVMTGGEALSADLISTFKRVLPHAQLLCGYAGTELGGAGLTRIVTEKSQTPRSVGRGFPNTDVYVLDETMNPVPFGVVGELCIGAAHLARGYVNQPDLTAERFVTRTLDRHRPQRIYRTGDLARLLPNGELEVLGRIDEQVKIRGFRIELNEIESVLQEHDKVLEAAVTVQDTNSQKRLIAYIVPAGGLRLTAGELRQFLQKRLPAFMIPAAFMFLAAMPLTPAGKLDRRALPPPLACRPDLDTVYEPPRNDVEAILSALWSEVLQIDEIGIHDNFLDLGGDSLLAGQVMWRLQEEFADIDFELSTLFDLPTVRDIATYISGKLMQSSQ